MGLFKPPDVARLAAVGKIDGLVRAAKYKHDPAVREAARAALEENLDALIQRLQTKNLSQLQIAREGLILIGPPARDRLIHILGVGHVHRRQDAAFVLGEMGDPEAVKPLCTALHNPDGLLRLLCVEALGKIGDPSAAPILKKALRDPEPRVAKAAQKALAGMEARSG